MGGRSRSLSARLLVAAGCAVVVGCMVLAGCAVHPYSACPVELPAGRALPPDAFARCRDVLLSSYGGLTMLDEGEFLLTTDWTVVTEPPGQRRASIFRDRDGLAVMVEARFLVEPPIGLPYWSSVRGDHAAERELADRLIVALAP